MDASVNEGAAEGFRGLVLLLRGRTGLTQRELAARVGVHAHSVQVWEAGLSADGRFVASGGPDGTVRLWDPGGACLAVLTGHSGGVGKVALSADGRLVASGGLDGTVRLWDPRSRACLAVLTGHAGGVWEVALSADGRLVVSGGGDGAVRLWDSRSHAQLRALRPDRPYERMDITGLTGVNAAQREALRALGAVDRRADPFREGRVAPSTPTPP